MSEKPERPKSFAELLAGNYQFYLFLFSIFAVAMGFARAFGKTLWEDIERGLRKEQNLPVATLSSAGDSSFTYSSLLQSGLFSIALVSVLSLYIVFMLAFFYRRSFFTKFRTDPEQVLTTVATLSLYPILMISFHIYGSFNEHMHKFHVGYLIGFGGGVVAVAALGLIPIAFAKSARTKIVLVMVCISAMALLASYATGQSEGIDAADPTTHGYVAVETAAGPGLEGWLYDTTALDYRLVTKDGSNIIIPAATVRAIREQPKPGAGPTPPATDSPPKS